MQADVYLLPGAALPVQSFTARGKEPYLDAHEELRAAVVEAFAAIEEVQPAPYERCAVTIVCYVGKRVRDDGRYRPERTLSLHLIVDPIYRALIDAGVIASTAAVYAERLVLVRPSEREGWRIAVEPIKEAA